MGETGQTKRPPDYRWSLQKNGAGEGNRTLVTSLEGWRSTIELHPHVVGAAGFEPADPLVPNQVRYQTALCPVNVD